MGGDRATATLGEVLMTPIPRGLLIAGGLGLAAGGGFLLFKHMGDTKAKEAADPALADPAAAGAGGMTPTAGTPGAGGLAPTGPGAPGAGLGAGTGAGSGSGKLAGGQQVGPYTVIPDPQSGQMVVFETATEQPVGILDAQGNLVPIEGSGGAQGPAAGLGAGTAGGIGTGGLPSGANTAVPEGAGLTPTGSSSSVPQAQAGQAQFAAIAKDLFANAGNGGVGSASSDAMAGQTNLSPTTGLDAGATSSSSAGLGATTGLGAGTGTGGTATAGTGTSGAASGGVTREQVGTFTLIDDGSGTKVVLDTASQTPVAMMDAAGTVTPISVDAQGNVSVTGAPVGSAASGAASLGAGTAAPTGLTDASARASLGASTPSVTSPTTITSPVGAGVPGLQ
ncbi:MAG: hypothetical protein JWL76_1121 [Thermoleophilia bacterium]|nr:hypothetical protein [Thermoleophilia bacterium]